MLLKAVHTLSIRNGAEKQEDQARELSKGKHHRATKHTKIGSFFRKLCVFVPWCEEHPNPTHYPVKRYIGVAGIARIGYKPMKYRQLGKTGITVSEIGFGTWGLGGDKGGSKAYGPTDDRQSAAALNRAFDLGITFYDTADLYGFGHSESLLGKTFKRKRFQVIIAGKVGFLDLKANQDFSPDHIRQSLSGSLQRLGTDYIDVYQLHSPSIEMLECMPEALETMKCLKQEGLVKSYGVSLRSPDEGLKLLRLYPVDCIQVNFNLTDQRALQNGLFDLCSEMGVGVIVRTPLCFGFLTGEYADKNRLAESDHRRKWPQAQIKLWNNAAQLFARFLKNEKQTKAQLALRFCLSFQAVSTAIPGMLTGAQVGENTRASRMGVLTPEELAEIRAIYASRVFFCAKEQL